VIENLDVANLSGILNITASGLLTALTAEFTSRERTFGSAH
jgi:hypothetical protein